MTDTPPDVRTMSEAEFEAALGHMKRQAWEQANVRVQQGAIAAHLRHKFPDHRPPAPQSAEPPKDDAADEERLAAITEKNAKVDAEVKAIVERRFPHLFDGERKSANEQSEIEREVADAAAEYFRNRGE